MPRRWHGTRQRACTSYTLFGKIRYPRARDPALLPQTFIVQGMYMELTAWTQHARGGHTYRDRYRLVRGRYESTPTCAPQGTPPRAWPWRCSDAQRRRHVTLRRLTVSRRAHGRRWPTSRWRWYRTATSTVTSMDTAAASSALCANEMSEQWCESRGSEPTSIGHNRTQQDATQERMAERHEQSAQRSLQLSSPGTFGRRWTWRPPRPSCVGSRG